MLGLWRMMKGFRWLYLGATATLAVSTIARTEVYLVLQNFIDNVIIGGNYGRELLIIILSFFGLAFLQGAFSFLSGWMASKTAEGITLRLRNYLFDHLQRLPYAYHAETQTGDLISRATSDVDAINRFYSEQAIGIGRILLMFVVNFIALLQLNQKLALISVIAIPVIIGTSIFFFSKVSKAYEKYQEQEATLSSRLQENLTGIRVVKAFARQGYESYKFDRENWEKFRLGKKLLTIHSLFWPVSDLVCGAQMLTSFFMGAIMALNGEITVGTYIAFASLVVWIIWPMRGLGRLIVQTSTGLVSYKRVTHILEQERESLVEGSYKPEGNVKGEIIFDHVSFEYEANNPVLQDINFTCQPGDVIALLGSTGSGKTSLVNLLPRFYDPTSGMITLDGVDL
ncbi:MAG: ATP-binding cassette domain-containing protein, partial [Anaerolineaceae bacterium]|nr:ATP-binding cassette domain-containing protein [Anaerolineaceae bacterium]